MRESILKDAARTGERVVEQFAASREALTGVWDDTRHFVKRTHRSVRDFLGDASYNIKRSPLRSIGLAFGAGAIVGLLISRTGRR